MKISMRSYHTTSDRDIVYDAVKYAIDNKFNSTVSGPLKESVMALKRNGIQSPFIDSDSLSYKEFDTDFCAIYCQFSNIVVSTL